MQDGGRRVLVNEEFVDEKESNYDDDDICVSVFLCQDVF